MTRVPLALATMLVLVPTACGDGAAGEDDAGGDATDVADEAEATDGADATDAADEAEATDGADTADGEDARGDGEDARMDADPYVFSRRYEGAHGQPRSIVRADGDGSGYVVVGYARAISGGADTAHVTIAKVDRMGNPIWNRALRVGDSDDGFAVTPAPGGGYAVGATSWPIDLGSKDFLLIVVDEAGEPTMIKSYDQDLGWEEGRSLVATSDGGLAFAGYRMMGAGAGADFALLKLDEFGNILWGRTYGGGGDDVCSAVAQTPDGGFLLGGTTNSFGPGGSDILLLKLDGGGAFSWARSYGWLRDDQFGGLTIAADGGVMVVGVTQQFDYPGWDILALKLTSGGEVEWAVTLGAGSTTAEPRPPAVVQTPDLGYLVAGSTWGGCPIGAMDMVLAKLDSSGGLVWNAAHGTARGEWVGAVTELDGYAVMAGTGWDGEVVWTLTKVEPGGSYPGCLASCAFAPSARTPSVQPVTGATPADWSPSAVNASFTDVVLSLDARDVCTPGP